MKKTLVTFVGALLGFGMLPMLMGPSGGYPSIATFQKLTVTGNTTTGTLTSNGVINTASIVNTGSDTAASYAATGAVTGASAAFSGATNDVLTVNSAASSSDLSVMCATGQVSGSRCWLFRLGGVNDWILASATDAGASSSTILDITRGGAAFLTENTASHSAFALTLAAPNTAGQSNGLLITAGANSADDALAVNNAANSVNLFVVSGNGATTQTGDASSVHNGSMNVGDTSGAKSVVAANVSNTGEASLIANASGGQAACLEANNSAGTGNCSTPAGHAGLATTGTMNLDPANNIVTVNGHAMNPSYAHIDGSSGTSCLITASDNFGASSCARAGVGNYTVTMSRSFSSVPVCVASATLGSAQYATASWTGSNTMSLHAFNSAGTAVDISINYVCMGGA